MSNLPPSRLALQLGSFTAKNGPPGSTNITPGLSRPAQWTKAYGNLYLTCALHNELG